jgi:dihydrolipoamide dehydrogenase
VTVIEFLDTITPSLDKEIAKSFQRILTKQGFKFQLGTKVTETSIQDNGMVSLSLEPAKGGEKKTFEADVVLVSTGRRPFTKNIGLEELKIETDRIGRIKVHLHFLSYPVFSSLSGEFSLPNQRPLGLRHRRLY